MWQRAEEGADTYYLVFRTGRAEDVFLAGQNEVTQDRARVRHRALVAGEKSLARADQRRSRNDVEPFVEKIRDRFCLHFRAVFPVADNDIARDTRREVAVDGIRTETSLSTFLTPSSRLCRQSSAGPT